MAQLVARPLNEPRVTEDPALFLRHCGPALSKAWCFAAPGLLVGAQQRLLGAYRRCRVRGFSKDADEGVATCVDWCCVFLHTRWHDGSVATNYNDINVAAAILTTLLVVPTVALLAKTPTRRLVAHSIWARNASSAHQKRPLLVPPLPL